MKRLTTTHQPLFTFLLLLSSSFPSLSQYPPRHPSNPRLDRAFTALQSLKRSITADPKGLTANWLGRDVCRYTGVFCAPLPGTNRNVTVVAGIDLNHGNIAGTLPEDLGLLSDLALFHINSNRFSGSIPESFAGLRLLFELDVSNNLLCGPFPSAVLHLPSLKFLDIRYNDFSGEVPDAVFNLELDALFVNNNQFSFSIPENIGNSKASVLVFANNDVTGCIPPSIGQTFRTLNQLVILNGNLSSCLPPEIGNLSRLTVLDVSFNGLSGPLPDSFGGLRSLEQLDVARNRLSGGIPDAVCELPRLKNFTYSDNFFDDEPKMCLGIETHDDRRNCIPRRPKQRPEKECQAVLSDPVRCEDMGCFM